MHRYIQRELYTPFKCLPNARLQKYARDETFQSPRMASHLQSNSLRVRTDTTCTDQVVGAVVIRTTRGPYLRYHVSQAMAPMNTLDENLPWQWPAHEHDVDPPLAAQMPLMQTSWPEQSESAPHEAPDLHSSRQLRHFLREWDGGQMEGAHLRSVRPRHSCRRRRWYCCCRFAGRGCCPDPGCWPRSHHSWRQSSRRRWHQARRRCR